MPVWSLRSTRLAHCTSARAIRRLLVASVFGGFWGFFRLYGLCFSSAPYLRPSGWASPDCLYTTSALCFSTIGR
ncbi:hypothetical protein F4823DRAFT_618879 [Ustulina deusta]|nr:hypothetical protein F4823DRAFT_618879 [Ustulina deusta]